MEDYLPLSENERRTVCVHEAGHAVVAAMSGIHVYSVEVAPVGAVDWVTEGRKGPLRTDLYGICRLSDADFMRHLQWHPDECYFSASKREFIAEAEMVVVARPTVLRQRLLRQRYFDIRSHLCATLAGPIAESIYLGDEPYLEPDACTPDDVQFAYGLCGLLPFRNEFPFYVGATTRLLQTPDVWTSILQLAKTLERDGLVEAPHPALPTASYHRRFHPYSPRSRQC